MQDEQFFKTLNSFKRLALFISFIFSICETSLGVGSIISISSFSLALGKIVLKQSNLSL
ncbi:unnamed protein product [Moneuplotes crassus]|uniref:Uncharacterized protein n=1 Tax=Euplotes crassus TaxID=5936 RepID=A0AAD1XCQ2_EUPCR|nr:unnamed protein product [Moneuplotes crassus]